MDRFQELRDSKLRHKPDVEIVMGLARHFRAMPEDLYDVAYKELQEAMYRTLQMAYAAGRMSTESWK